MSDNDFDRSDFYSLSTCLPTKSVVCLHAVRKFMMTDVAPVLLEHWSRVTFPFEIVSGDARTGRCRPAIPRLRLRWTPLTARRHDRDGARAHGLLDRHLQRCARLTGNGVGLSVQRERFLPAMARYDKIGSFGLTEPEVGSGAKDVADRRVKGFVVENSKTPPRCCG